MRKKSFPLLQKTFECFKNRRDLSKTYLFACQHILRPREVAFDRLVKFGIPRENVIILGKAYSTNERVLKELLKAGFIVRQPGFDHKRPFDEQHAENCRRLFIDCIKKVKSPARVIVMDDGAALLTEFDKGRTKIKKGIDIVGIEQTSSGFRKLENRRLHFPVINVARSFIKLEKESPHIAKTCLEVLRDWLLKKRIKNQRFMVIGLGPIGRAFLRLLKQRGLDSEGFDCAVDGKDILARIEKHRPNILVGATGEALFSTKEIGRLNDLGYPIFLASVSSSDREFPVASYRKNGPSGLHDDIKHGNVTFLNNGFPLNFEFNRRRMSADKIERTLCLLMGSVLHLASLQSLKTLPKKLINVTSKITRSL